MYDDHSVCEGDVLCSPSSQYLVECFLGGGTFGTVARCTKTKCTKTSMGQSVAVKIFRNYTENFKDAMHELAQALVFLTEARIIHMDLKPENIMVSGQEVKVIDFGSACKVHCSVAMYGQTLPYRAPEVMLGLPATCSADMWSLGCILAELVQGSVLYPGKTEYQVWQYILKTNGELPQAMLDNGDITCFCLTDEAEDGGSEVWRLKSPEEYGEVGISSSTCRSLDNVVKVGNVSDDPRAASITDLMKRMLQLDPNQRISPREMLDHPFIYQDRPAQLVQPKNWCPECLATVRHPKNCCPECGAKLVQPKNRCPKPSVGPNGCFDVSRANSSDADSYTSCITPTSCKVSIETVEVQPTTGTKKNRKKWTVKTFFNLAKKNFCSCYFRAVTPELLHRG
ncbi:hypothetical protein NHX12_020214 [Muraenolepis orangiensis]|uniref:Protein kinase domain-containing protein n=1 Tax=Muraenolepis orangiensis TaxID=630683 RepID=A0A9Q0IUV4_9TELE|nr:hypothetical protein NHX12_020214 [Muraenolepis orangiensis]